MTPDTHITITIPTKNQADTITQTLRELNNQTLPPDTVLIGDDSTDDTRTTIRDYEPTADYDIQILDAPGGVGAAREQLRQATPDGLLVCLDAEVHVPEHWLQEHIELHADLGPNVVLSGPWHEQPLNSTQRVRDPRKDYYFIEANCSMHTSTAEAIGGWDPRFSRGCDWDFRIRLYKSETVTAVPSPRVSGRPYDTNSSPWLHVKKQLKRPSSIPYLEKYGRWYLGFHPLHVLGDGIGTWALTLLPFVALKPSLCAAGLLAVPMALYAWVFNPPHFSPVDRVVSSVAVFALGISTLRAVTGDT